MISVCMATYNGERFIKEQIDSILSQLNSNDELIISDDGSTDRTLSIITSYCDNRIKVLHHQKNPAFAKIKYSRNFYYATSNFENALNNAKGDYIFLSDQDDVWMPGKVKTLIPLLDEYDCVMCNNQIIDAQGNSIDIFLGEKLPFEKSVFVNLKRTPFLGCCMVFSRRAMKYLLPFPQNLICHDLWMGCLCAHYGSIKYIKTPLHRYRFHEDSVSPSVTTNSKNPFLFKIKYRIIFLYQFLLRILKIKFLDKELLCI